MTANDLLGADELFSQQTRNNSLGHHATANERKSRGRKRVWLFVLVVRFSL